MGLTQGGHVRDGRASEKWSRVFSRDIWEKLSIHHPGQGCRVFEGNHERGSRSGERVMSVQADLDIVFPGHRSPERAAEWEALKQRLAIGQPITGTVVARSPFGAWVDLGVGFPALLEITVMAGLTPERYRAGDWCPVGSEVTANVGSFRDDNRQVGLWQVPLGRGRSTAGASGMPG
jgi:hypothetical protein